MKSRGHAAAGNTGELPFAARSLSQHAGVPLAIEPLPAGQAKIPIEIEAANQTVAEILEQMVRQDPRYQFRERLGVIEVLPVGADQDQAACLNKVVPLFEALYNWNQALMSVECVIAGKGQYCGGSFSVLRHQPTVTLNVTFQNENIRDIMDKLAALGGNVGWQAVYQKANRTCESLSISAYHPREWYPIDPDASDGPFAEGLPAKCTSCHYHEEQKK